MLEGYRRWLVVLIPVVVMMAQAAGVPLTEDALTDLSDKLIVAVMAGLALWSKMRPS